MGNKKKVIMALGLIVALSSCGINSARIWNHNQNATQVNLSSDNFKVVGRVKGQSDVSYVLIFGGAKKTQLYDAAYSNMLEKAELDGGSRAVTNVLTEEHVGGVPPFYYTRTLTVSAYVVEFTE